MEGPLWTLLILSRSIDRHGCQRQFFFWLAYLKKSSPLKPFGQMNQNLVWSIYGRSSIKIAHFVLICPQTWPPQATLVSDWLISKKKSSPRKQLVPQNRMKGEWHRLSNLEFYLIWPFWLQGIWFIHATDEKLIWFE